MTNSKNLSKQLKDCYQTITNKEMLQHETFLKPNDLFLFF
jgi:hypothetical protein